jgi:LCP family protein required for cell wall assembly
MLLYSQFFQKRVLYMSNNYYGQDEPTLPAHARPPQQNQQEKLIIGNFQDQPQPSPRRPYQYPPPAQQPPYTPQGMSGPAINPQTPQMPPIQSAQFRADKQAASTRRPLSRRKGCLVGCLVVLLLACVIGGLGFSVSQRVLAFGDAISTQKSLTTQTGYMGTSERTNLLVIGYGGGEHEGALLTDSLLVVSLMPQSHHTSLISIPRDLQVQVPEDSGNYGKINSVYEIGSNFGKDRVAGGNALARKVSKVTGLNVKYWMTIDFHGFRDLIDALGGIDVYVPNGFTANYPKNDDPKIDASWITVRFKKGNQHMNGETAIRYSRARYVTDNPAESTDYARSARQQIVVKAVLAKVKETSSWPKFYNAMDALQKTIFTNLSLADLAQFALKMDMNDPKTARIGLSNANVLEEDASFNTHPKGGNWQLIIDYINKNLYK